MSLDTDQMAETDAAAAWTLRGCISERGILMGERRKDCRDRDWKFQAARKVNEPSSARLHINRRFGAGPGMQRVST